VRNLSNVLYYSILHNLKLLYLLTILTAQRVIILMLLSFMNPFMGIPNVTVAYGVALDVMHIVVALAILYFIQRAKKSNA